MATYERTVRIDINDFLQAQCFSADGKNFIKKSPNIKGEGQKQELNQIDTILANDFNVRNQVDINGEGEEEIE